jgi:hypothetical protein
MRLVSVFCLIVALSGLAAAQATVVGENAGNWGPSYGVYAAPFVPRISTPSVTLSTVSPSGAGASNATFGLVAGATNSTLSDEFVGPAPVGVYTQPVWYGPESGMEVGGPMHGHHMHGKGDQGAFDFIAASRESTDSVARLMASSGPARKASRTYTNLDVDRVNQSTGTVKYRGKTEHI